MHFSINQELDGHSPIHFKHLVRAKHCAPCFTYIFSSNDFNTVGRHCYPSFSAEEIKAQTTVYCDQLHS